METPNNNEQVLRVQDRNKMTLEIGTLKFEKWHQKPVTEINEYIKNIKTIVATVCIVDDIMKPFTF